MPEVAVVLLLLLIVACRDTQDAPQPFRTTPLSGKQIHLRRFEGRWFDHGGALVAVVSGGAEPRLAVRLPTWDRIDSIDGARVRSGVLLFDVRCAERDGPMILSLRLIGRDRARMERVSPAFICSGSLMYPPDLLRDPSPLWFAKLAAQEAAQVTIDVAQLAYDTTLDWLAQRL